MEWKEEVHLNGRTERKSVLLIGETGCCNLHEQDRKLQGKKDVRKDEIQWLILQCSKFIII